MIRTAVARTRGLAALPVAAAFACAPRTAPATAEAGEPLAGLSADELTEFQRGAELFDHVYTPDEGLGPFYNENQCSACHTDPASGGTTGFERVVKATRYEGDGRCDLMSAEGGENIRSRAIPLLRNQNVTHESVPAGATEVGRFTPTALFGLGLVEAIPTEQILAQVDSLDADGDGISGRPGLTVDGRLARFGRKLDALSIRDFTVGALHLEMGLTTSARPHDALVADVADADRAADPEVDSLTVARLTTFVRLLAAPAPAVPHSSAHADTIAAGRRLFGRLGCAGCHTPSMRTGESDVAALAHRTVELYSDLLLHDMGPALASTCSLVASPAETRTAMLMGVRHRQFLLHDGRASQLRDAILLHGGEAQRARDGFARLPWLQQEILIEFLRSL